MKGKAKCKALKEIRRQIAEKNDIPYVVSQCTYQGDCLGTCPKCEAELRYLERELAVRQNLGKAVAVVGISLGACSTLTACSPVDTITNIIKNIGHEELAGDVTEIELTGDMPAPTNDPEELAGDAPIDDPEEPDDWLTGVPAPTDGGEILGGLAPIEEDEPGTDDPDELTGDIEMLPEEFDDIELLPGEFDDIEVTPDKPLTEVPE